MALSFFVMTNGEVERAVRHDVESMTGLIAGLMRERAANLQRQTTLAAKVPALKNSLLYAKDPKYRKDPATVIGVAHDIEQTLGAAGILVTDQYGQAIGGTGCASQLQGDLSTDTGVSRAMQSAQWNGVVVVNGQLAIATSVPIHIGEEIQGTLTAYTLIAAETARQLKESLSIDVAFLVKDKVTGASRPFPVDRVPLTSTPKQLNMEGGEFIAMRAPLPGIARGQQVSLIVLRKADELVGGFREFSFAFFAILTLSSLVAFLLAGRFADRITRPLGGVVRAAQTLSEGGWPDRFEVRRNDEIGILQNTFNEMTEALQDSQRRLLAMIDTDPLTELDNHRRFKEMLATEVSRCQTSEDPLALILLNLDHFGRFNEGEGHAAGDELLRRVTAILREHAPELSHLARQTGDGFAVTLPLHDLDQAAALAEQVRARIASAYGISASFGCAQIGPSAKTAESLFLAAELALERAKHLGRNQVSRFDQLPGADHADPFELYENLQDGSLATIQALAAAVDAKDQYTRGHSQRVAEYASDLCRYVGGSEEEAQLVYRTGTLHDVGKIGVPDSILKKPARLTDEEREVMESHPALGEVIVRKVPQLAETLPGVRHHHERFDGKGYPDKLQGTAIPRLARLLAIADTFDAMTSDRPYRKGLPIEVALEEIEHGAGTQFDPQLAVAFARMMAERHGLADAA